MSAFSVSRRRTLAAVASVGTLGSLAPIVGAATSVRIGQSLPLTGPLGSVVKPIAEGQKALLDELNAEGGVRGARIELLTLDDGAQPDSTAANTRRLIEDESVTALFGYAFVPGLLRALPLANEKGVPLLGVYNGADIARTPANPSLFTTTASLADEVAAMVRNLASLNTRKFALAFQNNELGSYMRPLVEAAVQKHQGSLLATVPLQPDGSNAAQAAQEIAARAPEAILLLAAGAPVLGFMKALTPSARVSVYALSLAGTTALLEQIGPAARGMAFTQVVPFPLRQTTPLTRRFTAAMTKAGLAPTYDRMWGYLNASVLAETLRRTGPNPTPASVYSTLEKMSDVDIGGYRLSFGPNRHHGSSFVEITVVDQYGKFLR
ncbi:ABC transporter substrate-binding protein [Polaromonas sp.]|uniref:ABC transporter substrate-binding protein n=1 Tax=Polaromonas sp. TaxID=1869339 RepID=UPI003BAD260C